MFTTHEFRDKNLLSEKLISSGDIFKLSCLVDDGFSGRQCLSRLFIQINFRRCMKYISFSIIFSQIIFLSNVAMRIKVFENQHLNSFG